MKTITAFFLSLICSLSLAACAQPTPTVTPKPAEITPAVSKPKQTAAPVNNTSTSTPSSQDFAPMIDLDNPPRGTAIPAAELKKQILGFIASLQKREDTNYGNLERVTGVVMHLDPEWDRNRLYWGQTTEGWNYWFSVDSLQNEPASNIHFRLFHNEQVVDDALPKTCTLDFEDLAKDLVGLGYERREKPFRRRWGFGKTIIGQNIGIGIGVKVYRLDNGTEDGYDCIESIHIGSGTTHE
jgi:hypothetical protein